MVAEVGLVAAMLDGRIGQQKMAALATAIRLLPGLSRLSESELNLLIARTGARTQKGLDWLCEVAHRIRSQALKRVAFRLAALMCVWSGTLDARQQEFLITLASGFGFSDAAAAALFTAATGWELAPGSGEQAALATEHS